MRLTPELAYKYRFGKDLPYDVSTKVIEQQLTRGTVRKFSNRPLEPGLLELLIASAQCSATSGGLQSYSIIALTKDEVKDAIEYKKNKNFIGSNADPQNLTALDTCAVCLIWVADLHRTKVLIDQIPNIDPEIANQPHTAEYQLKAIVDASITSQSFAICAESVGLGVMYWGSLRQLPIEFLEKKLNLPKLTFPLFGMFIGYPEENYKINVRPRVDTSLILHNREYKSITNFNDLEKYALRFELRAIRDNTRQRNFASLLIDRLSVAECKTWIANSLKYMGFTFK
jgi:FMN reductase (NADPH)